MVEMVLGDLVVWLYGNTEGGLFPQRSCSQYVTLGFFLSLVECCNFPLCAQSSIVVKFSKQWWGLACWLHLGHKAVQCKLSLSYFLCTKRLKPENWSFNLLITEIEQKEQGAVKSCITILYHELGSDIWRKTSIRTKQCRTISHIG